jgi:predicted nucleic acid-binding Zn ribbon protein
MSKRCLWCGNKLAGLRSVAVCCSDACSNKVYIENHRQRLNALRRRARAKRKAAMPIRHCPQCGKRIAKKRYLQTIYCSALCKRTAYVEAHRDELNDYQRGRYNSDPTKRKRAAAYYAANKRRITARMRAYRKSRSLDSVKPARAPQKSSPVQRIPHGLMKNPRIIPLFFPHL